MRGRPGQTAAVSFPLKYGLCAHRKSGKINSKAAMLSNKRPMNSHWECEWCDDRSFSQRTKVFLAGTSWAAMLPSHGENSRLLVLRNRVAPASHARSMCAACGCTHPTCPYRVFARAVGAASLSLVSSTPLITTPLRSPSAEALAPPGSQPPPRADPPELAPRLCHLTRSGAGYGFNLHSDRSRPGQYIRSLDPGSPADHAGLRPQDRLVEVNGVNIEGMRHAEVVAFIKKGGDATWLLVVDPETDAEFKRRGIVPAVSHVRDYDGPSISNGSLNPRINGSSTTRSIRSTRSDLSSRGDSTQLADDDGGRAMDPFAEMGLSLSATAAEEKLKVHAKEKKKAPQMDWMKKYELFSNF
ncbi:Na(+)/H(+) exchange regulatory cofactor NHE-RF2 isoform 2-T3 [Spinachia spinachia]